MKKKPEYIEGNQAFQNFDSAMDALMKVPHSEIKAKLDAEKHAKGTRLPKKASRRVKSD
jgi:hypothetical protein